MPSGLGSNSSLSLTLDQIYTKYIRGLLDEGAFKGLIVGLEDI